MDDKQQQILIYTFALQFNDEQLKEQFKEEKINQEQYLKITDLKRDKTEAEINSLLVSLKNEMRLEEENKEKAKLEKQAKRDAQAEKINNSKKAATENLRKNKEKYKKIGLKIVVLLVFVLALGTGVKFLFTNYVGFTDVDLGSMVMIEYDTDAYVAFPTYDWNGYYYNEGGYYDDFKEGLESSGIYSQDEIEALIPTYSSDIKSAVTQMYTSYDVSTNNSLKNGDTVEVTVNYDQDIAKQNKINVTNNKASFEIKGLREQVTSDEITSEALDSVGGLETIQNELLAEEAYDDSNYTSNITAVKFLFEDAMTKVDADTEITSEQVEDMYEYDYDYEYDGDYESEFGLNSDEYTQHVYVAYYMEEAYTDDDGKRDEDNDENYLCSQEFDVYKQNGKVQMSNYGNSSTIESSCDSLNSDVNTLNDAIEEDGWYLDLPEEYTNLEEMM